jgi:hypothetical protein
MLQHKVLVHSTILANHDYQKRGPLIQPARCTASFSTTPFGQLYLATTCLSPFFCCNSHTSKIDTKKTEVSAQSMLRLIEYKGSERAQLLDQLEKHTRSFSGSMMPGCGYSHHSSGLRPARTCAGWLCNLSLSARKRLARCQDNACS